MFAIQMTIGLTILVSMFLLSIYSLGNVMEEQLTEEEIDKAHSQCDELDSMLLFS